MGTYVTVDEIKMHLNIETGHTGDDVLILNIIQAAELAVYEYLNGGMTLTGDTGALEIVEGVTALSKSAKQAIILLCAHFYLNRNMVSFAQGHEIPYAFKFLLNPYRIMAIQ